MEVPGELLARAPREWQDRADRIADKGQRRCLAERAQVDEAVTDIAGERFFDQV